MNILVTGGAGFIGSNLCRFLLEQHPEDSVTVVDALTYAGNLTTIEDLETNEGFRFHQARIEDAAAMRRILKNDRVEIIINCAAETHNDRSLIDSAEFLRTNVLGVQVLLELVKEMGIRRLVQVSTDEVYGSTDAGVFTEESPLQPNTPYSASKAAGDLLCRAYNKSYGVPVVVTRGGNTYGPYQYPEKLIPFFMTRFINHAKAPLYGDGSESREWIHVLDHAAGIDIVAREGVDGEVYNIGDKNELPNREVVSLMLTELGTSEDLVKRIPDPRGGAHDKRYSMDCSKAMGLGWKPAVEYANGLRETVQWYVKHQSWWRPIVGRPEYQAFVKQFYGPSLGADL